MKMMSSLSVLGLLLAILVVGSSRAAPISELPADQQPRILIVGAGIAGLSAAERLNEMGFRNYTILEASDRIGGRIRTEKFADGWVEIGAQWIHGQTNNVVYEYAKKHDLVDEVKSKISEGPPEAEFRSEQGKLLNQTVAKAILKLLRSKLDETQQSSFNNNTLDNMTVGAYLDQVIDNDGSRGQEADVLKGKIRTWFKRLQCITDGCADVSEISIKSNRNYETCDGDNTVNFKKGYSSLVGIVESHLRNDSVSLNSQVDSIRFVVPAKGEVKQIFGDLNVTTPVVIVKLKNGTRYVADHVIVTFSLGVLKHAISRSMFEPPLPEQKLTAIGNIGFGTVNKIFLEFDQPFWPKKNFSGYNMVFVTDEDQRDISTNWWTDIVGFYPALYANNTLVGWIAGHAANRMEGMDDRSISDACYKALIKFTGNKELPRVRSVRRSTWKADKYVIGSYSYPLNRAPTPSVSYDLVAQPVYDNQTYATLYPAIMFAGEATHTKYFSTVHGARESGIREAERIAAFYSPHTSTASPSAMMTSTSAASLIFAVYSVYASIV